MSSSRDSSSSHLQRSHRNRGHRETAIRHAGRAHIRGKIRRVWRPRYLELVRNIDELDMTSSYVGWVREILVLIAIFLSR